MRLRLRKTTRGQLEHRVGELEELLDDAIARLAEMSLLIRAQAPLVAELPAIACWTTDLITDNRELRERAINAERQVDRAVEMLAGAAFDD